MPSVSGFDNPDAQGTHKTHDDDKQSRDTGHTRHMMKKIQRHWAHKTHDEDNPEILGTQDT
jgi:hypothetical protein